MASRQKGDSKGKAPAKRGALAKKRKAKEEEEEDRSQTRMDSFLLGETPASVGPRYGLRSYVRVPADSTTTNLYFYSNKIPSKPDGDFIDEIHTHWYWDYEKLEVHHGYIQWLFPVFENGGLNMHAHALDKTEAKRMRSDFSVAVRILRSYKMMLNFYGLELVDIQTGQIRRHPNTKFWKERFSNLNRMTHNNLRISRIITSLGELGFRRYKEPLVKFFSHEIGTLKQLPNAKRSCNEFWKMLIKEDTPEYQAKTLETPKDREESVFFSHAEKKDHLWEEYLVEEAQYRERLEELRPEWEEKTKKAKEEREAWEEHHKKRLRELEKKYERLRRTTSHEDLDEEATQEFDVDGLLEHYGFMEEDGNGDGDEDSKGSKAAKRRKTASSSSSAPRTRSKSPPKRRSKGLEDDDLLDD